MARRNPYTDTFNAKALASRCASHLRFATEWGAWLKWDGQRWRRDDAGDAAVRAAMTTVAEFFQIAADLKKDGDSAKSQAADEFIEWAQRSQSAKSIRDMLQLGRTLLALPVDNLDRDRFALNTPSGTVDLGTGELRKHDPTEMITMITRAPYDAAARAPRFEAFLARVQPDPAMQKFLRRLAGYWATGAIREQILSILQGGGANGKSTFIGLVTRALGEYAITGAPDLLLAKHGESHPTELADLEGRRIVVCHEPDKGRSLAEGRIKFVTGNDVISARRMGKDFRRFEPTAKLALLCNPKPRIRGTDDAIRRRVKLIPFNVRIPDAEQNPDLMEQIWKEEAAGILNWIVQGAVAWNAEGLAYPAGVGDASRDYFVEQDVLAEFLAEKCELSPDAWTATGDLFGAYKNWCFARNEQPGEQRGFSDDLAERTGIERKRTAKGRGFSGIQLRQQYGAAATPLQRVA